MATYDLTQGIPSKIVTGDILNCPYSGAAITLQLKKGIYQLECWGGQGGDYADGGGRGSATGLGGYSIGTVTFSENKNVWLYSGGMGSGVGSGRADGGFNGGGTSWASSSSEPANGGGGGTDVRIGQDSLYARVIVAGGGGGMGEDSEVGGYGGGTTGGGSPGGSYGGTQTSGTSGAVFGKGANTPNDGGGGGGGWYGGGTTNGSQTIPTGNSSSDTSGASGGSGYIFTSSTKSSYPSGCLLTDDLFLENASMKGGNETIIEPNGTSKTGHWGNGYIRITVINAGPTYEGHKLDEPTPDYHITDDITLTPPTYDGYNIIRNSLVFNRTNTDVITAKNITNKVKTYQRLSDQEQYMFDYKLKGAYNYTDLNRVESYCFLIKTLLEEFGFELNNVIIKTNWTNDDIISKENLDRIKNNIRIIREICPVIYDTPTIESLNIGKNKINILEANNIEKSLEDLYYRLLTSRQMVRKCGVFRCGQSFIMQQKFRRYYNWDELNKNKFSEFDNEKISDFDNNYENFIELKLSKYTPINKTVKFINNYMKDIDGFTGYIYGGGDNPKYYWFNGDYKSLLQKTLQGGGRDVAPPTYEGETPTLEDIDYALICYYDDDDEELDRVIQKKQFTFDSFVPFEADPLVPKELDDVEGTIKVADFDVSLSSGMTDVIPTKQGYEFDGWEKVLIDDIPNDYNFKPKWKEPSQWQLISEEASITKTTNGADTNFGTKIDWENGVKYKYEFDYTLGSDVTTSTQISLRDCNTQSKTFINGTGHSAGQTGHISMEVDSNRARLKEPFVSKYYNNNYTITITNFKLYKYVGD